MAPDSAVFGIDDIVMIATAALVLLVLLVSVLWSLRPKAPMSAKQYDAELFKRRMLLDEQDFPMLHDVRLSDSRGFVMKVDHVIRLPASVVLVVSAPTDVVGPVKAHPSAGTWRFVGPDGKVKSMTNPVVTLHPLIHAIRMRFPLVRVRMLTVFPRTAELGQKPPRTVCQTESFIQTLKEMTVEDGAPSPAVEAAWDQLSQTLKQASAKAGAGR